MILRSQLRMNKNIVFPFISCILIVFTLLVLLHKSTDELMTVKKELNHCKEQYESTFTQLQSAIDLKLRLEKSLENEKSSSKQKADDIQAQLEQEKKDRQKDKNEANSKYDSLNAKFNTLQTENTELKDQKEKMNNELNDVNSKLKEVEKANEAKDQTIRDLQEQLKTANANAPAPVKKFTPSNDAVMANDSLKVAPVQNPVKDSPTPKINPAAVNNQQMDDSFKQVLQPPDTEMKENSMQKEMQESLNMGIAEQMNVVKPPMLRNEGNLENLDVPRNDDRPGMFLQKPPNFDQPIKPASSVSNNAAENPEVGLPQPAVNDKKKTKDYPNGDYENNALADDEGEIYPENGNRKDTN